MPRKPHVDCWNYSYHPIKVRPKCVKVALILKKLNTIKYQFQVDAMLAQEERERERGHENVRQSIATLATNLKSDAIAYFIVN